jgi:hypothetical protein
MAFGVIAAAPRGAGLCCMSSKSVLLEGKRSADVFTLLRPVDREQFVLELLDVPFPKVDLIYPVMSGPIQWRATQDLSGIVHLCEVPCTQSQRLNFGF